MSKRLYYCQNDSGGNEIPNFETFVPDLHGGLSWESPFDDDGKPVDVPDPDPDDDEE